MLDAPRIDGRKLLEPLDGRDIRHAVMPAGDNQRIERLLPPVVVLPALSAERQDPFIQSLVLAGILDCGVILDQILVAVAVEEIFDILPDDGMMAERGIFAMDLDRGWRSNGRDGLLRKRHDARVDVGFERRVYRRVGEPVLGRPRRVRRERLGKLDWRISCSIGEGIQIGESGWFFVVVDPDIQSAYVLHIHVLLHYQHPPAFSLLSNTRITSKAFSCAKASTAMAPAGPAPTMATLLTRMGRQQTRLIKIR